MTERKPAGATFESWVERQIRESYERGEFDDLPGSGEPFADRGQPYDELWWIKDKLRRENVTYLPPTLALRKEASDAVAAARRAGSEADARRIVEGINVKIVEAIRKPLSGPPLDLAPFDVERIVREWRERR
ncbi:MAG TPA: DnaJ family domain-containing protein [Thermomicrobiales bacterium]|nr:DnaJ family domain-containing protein [Thermomicrobiales bacterium]